MLFVALGSVTEFLSAAGVKGHPFDQRPLALRYQLLAQAVGRIAAHEHGHYLLQGRGHAARGLLRPHYTPDDLMAPVLARFEVPPDERPIIRREVARLAELQQTRHP